ncbi:MAG: isopeptide-forming domain-containing fimbrial protein [Oscillospiraceae bacterium]|nr:isopeptide-forming domain-containing fimbrial protein [Oscillospiraceae bacterium]
MKMTKRILSALLATLLLAAMTILPASAAGHTIRIANEAAGHTYEVYQIFSGVLNEKGIMTEIQWGSSVSAAGRAAMGVAETKAGTLKTVADAEAFGYEVDNYLETPVKTVNTQTTLSNGQKVYEITDLDTGYYLIMDKSGSLSGDAHDAYTQYIIQVVDNVEVSPKSAVPTLLKRVSLQQKTNYASAVSSMIGGEVYYQLIASMHSHISTYPEYYLQFSDTLPAGLKDAEVVSVGVANGENYAEQEPVPAEHYTFAYDSAANTVTVTMKDAKAAIKVATGEEALIDDKIVVTYKAVLDPDAVVGRTPTDGNVNTAVLFYSNDPNEDYDPVADEKPEHVGKTAQAEATVYTYQIRIKKIDASDDTKVLPGAQFIAYRYTGTNTKAYYQVDTATGKVTGLVADESQATRLTTDADGMLSIIGLPSGTHHFKEVVAPSGYNVLTTEISVIITAAADATTGKLDTFKGEATGTARPVIVDMEKGDLLVTVENRIGSTLPETGGIGTTIFYVAGIVLMLGAVAVIVAKKRSGETK